jgi:hypothetical protein
MIRSLFCPSILENDGLSAPNLMKLYKEREIAPHQLDFGCQLPEMSRLLL